MILCIVFNVCTFIVILKFMEKLKIFAHGSYIGNTGYNNHTRDFFRQLNKHCQIKFRNFTVGEGWKGMSETPHDDEPYITEEDKNMLYEQILWTQKPHRINEKIYLSPEKEFETNFHIVLNETNHHIFYDGYNGPKIAYNVWESTRQPDEFFEKLKDFDELWVPSDWQKQVTIEQGYNPDRIKVVPEGVDDKIFFPEEVEKLPLYKDERFKFILFGRWDYRKSTKEIIETFLKTFSKDEPIDLIVSIDNSWGQEMDGYENTEERLKGYKLDDPRIKIVHFPSRADYIKYIKTGHVFLSCARSEGWNLPLIEAMACGTPSIYSNCSGQLEFAKNKGLPVKVKGLRRAIDNDYGRYTMSDLVGDYYEPDFDDLSRVMRYSYENYESVKKGAMKDSVEIREKFNWDKIGEIGYRAAIDFYKKVSNPNYVKEFIENKIIVSYLEGPKVEIKGSQEKEYFIEFVDSDTNTVIHSDRIKNNMWTACGRKYYTNWVIKVDGQEVDKFNCSDKRVLISIESKAMGDTIAWAPYAIDFAKKHNCKVILSTFYNEWFRNLEQYKGIDFIEPGQSVGVYALFRIGWFRDEKGVWNKLDRYPNILNTIPLQQTATDILGLDFYEMNYGVDFKVQKRPFEQKYIAFGPNATAGAKEWTYEHWVELSKLLLERGYKIVIITKSPYKIENTINIHGKPISEIMNYLFHADFFIGLGSGLSWLNWALAKKTAMICGFSQDNHEFTSNVIRISNNICIKCWNDSVLPFDAGDWDWCPVYKGTSKQHICQKSITPKQVLSKITPWLI